MGLGAGLNSPAVRRHGGAKPVKKYPSLLMFLFPQGAGAFRLYVLNQEHTNMQFPGKVKMVEVGPRDGLQNEPVAASTAAFGFFRYRRSYRNKLK